MNTNPGIIGKKIGMTQFFAEDGNVVRCTVIHTDATVIAKRTQEKDGYDAIIIGLGERKEKNTPKPQKGQYEKWEQSPRHLLRELRMSAEEAAKYEIGQPLKLDEIFEVGQFVDVQGTTRGRGFSGVMRRWKFGGSVASHGTSEYKRHGGSIGANLTPGRTMPGKKMPGQLGNKTTSVLNLKIAQIHPDKNLLLIEGGVPGPRNAYVTVRGAVKKKNGGRPAK